MRSSSCVNQTNAHCINLSFDISDLWCDRRELNQSLVSKHEQYTYVNMNEQFKYVNMNEQFKYVNMNQHIDYFK